MREPSRRWRRGWPAIDADDTTRVLGQREAVRPAARRPGTGKGGHHDAPINHHHGGWYTMNAPAPITITPVHVADLLAEGEPMPLYVHVIDHPDARVLVDTGMTELHPALADLEPRIWPLSEQDFDLGGIDIVVNTHLHADHCGGNHLFAGRPIYVQRRELDDARGEDDYTIREWVEAPGVRYVPVDGELELLPGLRLVPAPGHSRGMQVVVVETGGRPVIVGGDVAVWFGELDEPHTEGQLRVLALDPELVWLAHEHEPWRPRTD
jgi:N-acyl homoserine lactone hydrolase